MANALSVTRLIGGFFCYFCRKFTRLFVPTKARSWGGWLWFVVSRLLLAGGSLFLALALLFKVAPVPFSAYMAQQKIAHWLDGEKYPIQYQWVSLDNIAWQMQLAVIAGEDQKFKDHSGVDWQAVEAALKRNAASNTVRGASTISQQTVKNLYLWHGSSWLRKGIELPLTLATEKLWSKARILEVYLNIAEFGEGIFGVEAAAQHYFKKSAAKLNQQEAAALAAVLPNPIVFKVKNAGTATQARQRWIINQMQNLGGQRYLQQLSQ